MKRRSFLGVLAGLFAVPAAAVLPAAKAPTGMTVFKFAQPGTTNLFRGEVGQWDGVRIVRDIRPYQEKFNRQVSAQLDSLQWSDSDIDRMCALYARPIVFSKLHYAPWSV